MKGFVILLVALGMLTIGCQRPGANTTTEKVLNQTQPSKKNVCTKVFQRVGKYSVVIVARCRATKKGPKSTIVSIAVINTMHEGKMAAEESFRILTTYFGGRPDMKLLTMGKVKNVPLYLFVLQRVLPRLPAP